ncbi:MAG: hypothetical protein ACRD4R_15785 [Candidatus Acidiferrales bacterium]
MTEKILQMDHYAASIPDKVGEGARVPGALRDAGVNLIAFWGYPNGKGRAQLEFIPESGAAFAAAAKQARVRVRKRTAFYVQGDDRPGAVADILQRLAEGRISVGALQVGLRRSGDIRRSDFYPACHCSKGRDCPGSCVGLFISSKCDETSGGDLPRERVIASRLPLTVRTPAKIAPKIHR